AIAAVGRQRCGSLSLLALRDRPVADRTNRLAQHCGTHRVPLLTCCLVLFAGRVPCGSLLLTYSNAFDSPETGIITRLADVCIIPQIVRFSQENAVIFPEFRRKLPSRLSVRAKVARFQDRSGFGPSQPSIARSSASTIAVAPQISTPSTRNA